MRRIFAYSRLAIGLGVVAFLVWYVDVSRLIEQLRSLDGGWLALGVTAIILSTIIGAINIHVLVISDRTIPLGTLMSAYWIAWAAGLVVPGQIGDVVSLAVLLRRHGVDWEKVVGRSLLDKAISFGVMFCYALLGASMLVDARWQAPEVTGPVFAAVLIVFGIVYWRRNDLRTFFRKEHAGVRGMVARVGRELVYTAQRSPRRVGVNLGLTVIKVAFIGASYWCVFAALGYEQLNLLSVIALTAMSSLVAYLPISFNGLGTVEVAGIALFAVLGLPEATVLSAYLVLRMLVLLAAWLPAGVLLLAGGKQAG